MKKLCIFFACVAVLMMDWSLNVYADELKVSSGGTTATYVLNPVKDHFEKATGIKLNVASVGGKFAILDVDKGVVEISGAAHTLEELTEIVKKDNLDLKNAASIQVHKAADPVKYALAVHRDNVVSKLTKEQIKGIFTGKIVNWKEIGGKDMPILIVVPKLQPVSLRILSNKLLDKEPVITDVHAVNVYADVKEAVAATPEAIGIMMHANIDSSVKAPEMPSLTTGPINLFTVGSPSPKARKLIDFVQGEGKKYILQ